MEGGVGGAQGGLRGGLGNLDRGVLGGWEWQPCILAGR